MLGALASAVELRVRDTLDQANRRLLEVAGELSARAGWCREGLEIDGRSISTFLEIGDVTFWLELEAEVDGFVIESKIDVVCDHRQDCGPHMIAQLVKNAADPEAAVMAVGDGAKWLATLARSRPPGSWRELDARSSR